MRFIQLFPTGVAMMGSSGANLATRGVQDGDVVLKLGRCWVDFFIEEVVQLLVCCLIVFSYLGDCFLSESIVILCTASFMGR